LLVFIDESGCAGFKLDKGSTPFFVVVLVIFADFNEAERTSAKIAEIRSALRVKPEFKFSKCSDDHRSRFFTALAGHKFSVRSIIIDKRFIYSAHLKGLPSAFYNYVFQSLLKHNSGRLKDAHIKIDGSGNRVFRRELYSYLRKQLPAGCAKSIKFADSKTDNLVQLADMCAGAIARSYPGRGSRSPDWQWRNSIRKQIEDVWNFR